MATGRLVELVPISSKLAVVGGRRIAFVGISAEGLAAIPIPRCRRRACATTTPACGAAAPVRWRVDVATTTFPTARAIIRTAIRWIVGPRTLR